MLDEFNWESVNDSASRHHTPSFPWSASEFSEKAIDIAGWSTHFVSFVPMFLLATIPRSLRHNSIFSAVTLLWTTKCLLFTYARVRWSLPATVFFIVNIIRRSDELRFVEIRTVYMVEFVPIPPVLVNSKTVSVLYWRFMQLLSGDKTEGRPKYLLKIVFFPAWAVVILI